MDNETIKNKEKSIFNNSLNRLFKWENSLKWRKENLYFNPRKNYRELKTFWMGRYCEKQKIHTMFHGIQSIIKMLEVLLLKLDIV